MNFYKSQARDKAADVFRLKDMTGAAIKNYLVFGQVVGGAAADRALRLYGLRDGGQDVHAGAAAASLITLGMAPKSR